MNILIINGSPRKKGLISQMLDIMREESENRGDKVQTVYTNDLNIKPCIGCMACRTKEKCVLGEDDSQRVLKMIQEADAIIMGAPCYWGNIPGQMKLLFDRIVYGMMRDTPRFPEPLISFSVPAPPLGLGISGSNSHVAPSELCVKSAAIPASRLLPPSNVAGQLCIHNYPRKTYRNATRP